MIDRHLNRVWEQLQGKKPHLPHFLAEVYLDGIRGIEDLRVVFDYPVSVIAGATRRASPPYSSPPPVPTRCPGPGSGTSFPPRSFPTSGPAWAIGKTTGTRCSFVSITLLPLGLREGETTVGQVLERIRRDSRDESEKGRWFANLVRRVLLENPEYEVAEVHRWPDWPERVEVTGLGGNDIGIDLVATPDNPAWNALADAWEQIRDVELLPMQHAEACEARRVIGEAAGRGAGSERGDGGRVAGHAGGRAYCHE